MQAFGRLFTQTGKRSDKGRLANNPLENIYLTAISLTGQFEFAPRTAASQLFAVSVAFMALIVASAYTANLASNLVVQNQPASPIQTLDDAVRMQVPICVWATTGTDSTITQAFPNGRIVRKPTSKEVFQGVISGECRVAATELTSWDYWKGNLEVNGECQLDWIGRIFRNVRASFALKSDSGTLCTSLIRDVLNLHLGEMKDDGFIDEAYDAYLARQAQIDCANLGDTSGSTSQSNQLGLKNMGGIFVFHFAISAVAIVLAFVGVHRRKRRKAKERDEKMNRKQRRLFRRQASQSNISSTDGVERPLPVVDTEQPTIDRMPSMRVSSMRSLDGMSVDSHDSNFELRHMEMEIKYLSKQNQQMHRTQITTTASILKQLEVITKRLEENAALLAAHESAILQNKNVPGIVETATNELERQPALKDSVEGNMIFEETSVSRGGSGTIGKATTFNEEVCNDHAEEDASVLTNMSSTAGLF